MADIVSAVASGAGLISLSIQLGECALKLTRLIKNSKDAPRSLEKIIFEIRTISLVLREIERDRIQHSDHNSELLSLCVEHCQRKTDEITALTQKLELALARSPLGGRLLIVARNEEVKDLCLSLESAKSSLSLAHQIYVESRREADSYKSYETFAADRVNLVRMVENSIAAKLESHQRQLMSRMSHILVPLTSSQPIPIAPAYPIPQNNVVEQQRLRNPETITRRARRRGNAERKDILCSSNRFRIRIPTLSCYKIWDIFTKSSQGVWNLNIATYNERPWGSEIFKCCKNADLEGVQRLLRTGAASVRDVTPYGHTLLGLIISDLYYEFEHSWHIVKFLLERTPISEDTIQNFFTQDARFSVTFESRSLATFVNTYDMCFDFLLDFSDMPALTWRGDVGENYPKLIHKSLSSNPEDLSMSERLRLLPMSSTDNFLELEALILRTCMVHCIEPGMATASTSQGFTALHYISRYLVLCFYQDDFAGESFISLLDLASRLLAMGASSHVAYLRESPLVSMFSGLGISTETLIVLSGWFLALENGGVNLTQYCKDENEYLNRMTRVEVLHYASPLVLDDLRVADYDLALLLKRTIPVYHDLHTVQKAPGSWPQEKFEPQLICWKPSDHEGDPERWQLRHRVPFSDACRFRRQGIQDDHCERIRVSRMDKIRHSEKSTKPRSSSQPPPFGTLSLLFYTGRRPGEVYQKEACQEQSYPEGSYSECSHAERMHSGFHSEEIYEKLNKRRIHKNSRAEETYADEEYDWKKILLKSYQEWFTKLKKQKSCRELFWFRCPVTYQLMCGTVPSSLELASLDDPEVLDDQLQRYLRGRCHGDRLGHWIDTL